MWQWRTLTWAERRWTVSSRNGKSASALGRDCRNPTALQISVPQKRETAIHFGQFRVVRLPLHACLQPPQPVTTDRFNVEVYDELMKTYCKRVKFFIKYILQHPSGRIPATRQTALFIQRQQNVTLRDFTRGKPAKSPEQTPSGNI